MDNEKYETLISLLDGAMPVVELWNVTTPSQIEWKKNWLINTRAEINEYVLPDDEPYPHELSNYKQKLTIMNNKIKELLIESGWPKDYINDHFEVNKRGDIESMKRFAELIVKECIDIFQPISIDDQKWSYDEMMESIDIQEKIKQHFGISS
jgi:hypothetical protein